ncbi:CsbA family protein [Siminovitchia sp. 179-K 8D1 HS]|uniref:CsbA family protein n=1 Tax=Siminovitchia sp. 179-K 8D1 HS TaxID=3142385 RepID=UPI0039A23F80
MIDKILSAIFLPAFLMVFFTRVTYSRLVGFLLTVALVIVSAYNGYLHKWWLIIVEAASLTMGLFIVNRTMMKKRNKNTS